MPAPDDLKKQLADSTGIARLLFETERLGAWDSGLLAFLLRVSEQCSASGIAVDPAGLPAGMQRLLSLATAVPERQDARRDRKRVGIAERVGEGTLRWWQANVEAFAFLGELFLAFLRVLRGRIRFRLSDLMLILQDCSANALPIVSLISLLVGLILAFVGAIQLRLFGAQIYVADLVGIAMTRAMGAIMTGIIMAGRTGASFAARIGTMQVNEEIDALKTTGIPPMDFLVVPRVIAMSIMMPLLTLYADFMGILGGLIVGTLGLGVNPLEFLNRLTEAVTLTHISIGIVSGFIFGIIISVAGCLRGVQCGRSASAVGDATTSAVVTSIVCIVIATAAIVVVCDILGI